MELAAATPDKPAKGGRFGAKKAAPTAEETADKPAKKAPAAKKAAVKKPAAKKATGTTTKKAASKAK